MKKYKVLLFFMILMLPTVVYGAEETGLPLFGALLMEAFISIHMSAFVLDPLSKILCKNGEPKKLFWKLFITRAAILLFFDFFITTNIAIIDFFSVFIGTFIVFPLSIKKENQLVKKVTGNQTITNSENSINSDIVLKCTKCDAVITVNHKFCDNCGIAITDDNIKVEPVASGVVAPPLKTVVNSKNFDSMFELSEESMLYEFLNKELVKVGLDKNSKLIPSQILKRRKILNIIFSFLTFCLISLIFFHFPIFTYVCGIIILFFSYKLTKGYSFMEYLKKEVKSRPSEKVSNIVMNLKQTMVEDTSGKILFYGTIISIILPLIIFIKPMVWYEKVDGGYGVRYYIFGLTNFTSATIPEKHNGENVVLLRGNTFSNMPFLKEINLPDSITEIRGQAFKNNRSLKSIKLPNNLNYLGGGAFYNCTSLEYIEIPDSVTYIGGEAFYNAYRLKRVKLSNNLAEIRGSTFENCISLETIEIPDSVTRIGGHAFYDNNSLSSVSISENSKLAEIGSSAFRRCNKLYEITIPVGVYVNERAFKESPTNVRNHGMADKKQYQYNSFFHIGIGENRKINNYRMAAIIQNESVTLLSIIQNNGLNEFTLSVNGQVFTLTSSYRYHEVNNNLVIEIEDDYVFENYYDKVSFYAYYN